MLVALASATATLAVVVTVVAGARVLVDRLPETPPPRLAIGLAVAALALALRVTLVPGYARLYTDEAFYVGLGAALADRWGVVGPSTYEKAYGWPALLGAVFRLTGPSPDVAVATSTTLAGATALGLTILTARLGRSLLAGAVAGLLVATWPLHGLWSRTAEANVAGGALAVALGLAALAHRDRPTHATAALVAATAALGTAIRPEVAGLALVAAALPGCRLPALAGLAWAAPNLAAYARVHLSTNAGRAALALGDAAIGPWRDLLGAGLHPWTFAALGLLGLVVAPARVRAPLGAAVLAPMAVLSLAGAGALTEPTRFLIVPGLGLAALAGLGANGVAARLPPVAGRAVGAALLVALAAPTGAGWRAAGQEQPGYALQQSLAARVDAALPAGCALIANLPELYAGLLDRPVLGPEALTAPPDGCVAFVVDLPCFEWKAPTSSRRCAAALARGEVIATFAPEGVRDPAGRVATLVRIGR